MKNLLILVLFIFFEQGELQSQRYLSSLFETSISNDIKFGAAIDRNGNLQELYLDLYEPQNDVKDKRPLIIYAHGGGFVDVNQDKSLTHIVAFCDSMSRKGYVVASIDYRLDESISNRSVVNAMHDMKAAVRFFRKEKSKYKIDPSLIFVAGESAGAVTALNTAYVNMPVESNYPPTLPLSMDDSLEGNSGNDGFSSEVTAALCYCGGTATIFNDLLFDTLSMNNKFDPPLLQVHGTSDFLIPIGKALDVAIRANSLELPFLFYALQEATHCPWFFPLNESFEYLDTLINFTVPFLYAAIQETTSIEEVVEDDKILIYPNPSSSDIHFKFYSGLKDWLKIEIYNSDGLRIKTVENNYKITSLVLEDRFDVGYFLVAIHYKDSIKYKRLVVVN